MNSLMIGKRQHGKRFHSLDIRIYRYIPIESFWVLATWAPMSGKPSRFRPCSDICSPTWIKCACPTIGWLTTDQRPFFWRHYSYPYPSCGGKNHVNSHIFPSGQSHSGWCLVKQRSLSFLEPKKWRKIHRCWPYIQFMCWKITNQGFGWNNSPSCHSCSWNWAVGPAIWSHRSAGSLADAWYAVWICVRCWPLLQSARSRHDLTEITFSSNLDWVWSWPIFFRNNCCAQAWVQKIPVC